MFITIQWANQGVVVLCITQEGFRRKFIIQFDLALSVHDEMLLIHNVDLGEDVYAQCSHQ